LQQTRSGLHRRFEAELVSVVSPATASPYCAQIVLGALIAAGLDNVTNVPAVIRNGRGDILATNELGRALFSEMYVQPARPVNHAGSSSSTSGRTASTPSGTTPQPTWSPCSATRPAGTPTTGP